MSNYFPDSGTLIVDCESIEEEALRNIAKEIFSKISHLELFYPNFDKWYFSKVVTGLVDGTRSFIIEFRDARFAGIAILKDTEYEKKICTISVREEYKSKGIGFRLFEKSILLLGTDKPLASVSEERFPEFEKLFNRLDFDYSEKYYGLYLPKKSELSFNGFLQ